MKMVISQFVMLSPTDPTDPRFFCLFFSNWVETSFSQKHTIQFQKKIHNSGQNEYHCMELYQLNGTKNHNGNCMVPNNSYNTQAHFRFFFLVPPGTSISSPASPLLIFRGTKASHRAQTLVQNDSWM